MTQVWMMSLLSVLLFLSIIMNSLNECKIKRKWLILCFNVMIVLWVTRYYKTPDYIIYEDDRYRIEKQWDLPPDIFIKERFYERSFLTTCYFPDLSKYQLNISETENEIIINAKLEGKDDFLCEISKR